MRPIFAALAAALLLAALSLGAARAADAPMTFEHGIGPIFVQNSMNVFRRHAAPAEDIYHFYGDVLGLKQLTTFNVHGAAGANYVARFQAGDSQVKFTYRVKGRSYEGGGVKGATGLRLLSFFFPDEAAVKKRFADNHMPAPDFQTRDGRRSALVDDPDGQPVELVIGGDPKGIEVGLTVADMATSVNYYKQFVGLDDMGEAPDPLYGGTKHSLKHGSTIVTLRSFGPDLPKDTGSGGIQFVVSDAKAVELAAKDDHRPIDQPLSKLKGFNLITIWLDDPDGITNYFAQVGAPPPPPAD